MNTIIKNTHPIQEYSLESYTVHSGVQGNNLLIIGAIHGNETCGPEAIQEILLQISSGIISILHGSITFIPISNPAAYEIRNRKLHIDLGRNFSSKYIQHTYEKEIVTIIEKYIQKCDYFLDIHSTQAKTDPCIFEDYPNKKTHNFSLALGIKNILTGWPNIYTELQSPDANMYAYKQGKNGVLIECGSHLDAQSKGIGISAIKKAINHTNTLHNFQEKNEEYLPKTIDMKKLYTKENDGELSKNWKNLEYIFKGTIIAYYNNGKKIIAPSDGYIILPKYNANIGEEWFYFGVD